MGLASFYRRYVHNFAKIASPLSKLTSIKTAWIWTDKEQRAFDDLKGILQNPPVLRLFDPDKPIFIDCDASQIAVGSILSQADDKNELHPVEYFSRCLNQAEKSYCVCLFVISQNHQQMLVSMRHHKLNIYNHKQRWRSHQL